MLVIDVASSVIIVTAHVRFRPQAVRMEPARPVLYLYVTRGCSACRRAEQTLRNCTAIQRLSELRIVELGEPGVVQPTAVVGGPTTMFQGKVVALGTPDCHELAGRLARIVAASALG